MTQTDSTVSYFIALFASTVSQVISKSLYSPFDVVQYRLQCSPQMIKNKTIVTPYTGIAKTLSRIISEEGIKALWKGNATNLLKGFCSNPLVFVIKDTFRNIFGNDKNRIGYWPWFFNNLASGGLAGSTSLFLIYSLDYAKTRLVNNVPNPQTGKKQFNGLFDVYKQTFRSDGISGFYRGFTFACVGIFFYRALYFGLYDSFGILIGNNLTNKFVLAFSVSIIAGSGSYFFDTIRRRMMMTSCGGDLYKGPFDCTKKIFANEGPSSFFKGLGVTLLRMSVSSLSLVIYDMISSPSSMKE